jgi:ElaB/YqjD/DUF883 family membrane-anchored ribosome-binding protein
MPDMKDRLKGKIDSEADKASEWTQAASNQARGLDKKFEETPGGAVQAVKDGVHDVATAASEFVNKAKDTAEAWTSSATDAVGQAKDKAQAVAADAVETVGEFGQEITAFIRRYPLQSLLVGFAAGFLAAQISRRS